MAAGGSAADVDRAVAARRGLLAQGGVDVDQDDDDIGVMRAVVTMLVSGRALMVVMCLVVWAMVVVGGDE